MTWSSADVAPRQSLRGADPSGALPHSSSAAPQGWARGPPGSALSSPALNITDVLAKEGAEAAKAAAAVTDLEGWNGTHYSGFFATEQGKMMYAWYFEASAPKAANPPLVIWLQGGPGGSSMFALFAEMVQGASVARAFGSERRLIELLDAKVDDANRALYMLNGQTNMWLKVMMNLNGSLVVAAVVAAVLWQRHNLGGAAAGLTLSYSCQFVGAIGGQFAITPWCEFFHTTYQYGMCPMCRGYACGTCGCAHNGAHVCKVF